MSRKKVIILVIVLAIIGISIYAVTAMGGGNAAAGLPVMSETAAIDTLTTTVNAKGEVSLLNVESIYSTIAAEVEEVYVEKNDIVKEGDPLVRFKLKSKEKIEKEIKDAELSLQSARLTLSSLRLPLTGSDAEVESARQSVLANEQAVKDANYVLAQFDRDIEQQRQTVTDARTNLDKINVLFSSGAAPKNDVDDAETVLTTAEVALSELLYQKEQKQTALSNAEQNLGIAQSQYTKVRDDYEKRLSNSQSQKTINISEQEIVVQKGELLLASLQKDLADFKEYIYSPTDATVTALSVSEGEITPTDKILMELANVEDYVIKVDVNERNASKIALGQTAEIEGPVLGDVTIPGTVTKIGTIADVKQTNNGTERVVPVEITVEKNEIAALLKPGFSLEAVITTGVYENVVAVPILSTIPDGVGGNSVFVIKDDNTLEKRAVTLGVYSGMVVEVTEGVADGEKIVAQPTLDMTDGMTVTVMNAEPPAQDEAAAGDAE